MIRRHLDKSIRASLKHFPAVLISGARQVGKSTLVEQLVAAGVVKTYISLDDFTYLTAARQDPEGFLKQFQEPLAIDEIQRAPDLMQALKKTIDQDRRPGRFLLTGSANILSYPSVSESLAGRIDMVHLEGLSWGELARQEKPTTFLSDLFSGASLQDLQHQWRQQLGDKPAFTKKDLNQHIFYGGFPEVALKGDAFFRQRWFAAYQTTYVERDVRDLSQLLNVFAFAKLFQLVGIQTGNIVYTKNLAVESGLDQRTAARYLEMMAMTFQINQLQPWFRTLRKRLIKTSKVYMNDAGQAAYLGGVVNPEDLLRHPAYGALAETCLWTELRKLMTFETGISANFYRTHQGNEVDFIISRGTTCWGIEFKAKESLSGHDLAGLHDFLSAQPEARGLILYAGEAIVSLTPQILAVPLRCLI